ncbi:hypothetical protein SLEP1_g17697 [Rubroshorea leprosula]|uniref:Uncharacterized protein n=1 Tax=Rubroshorea leprosula TaxID=152421 RepID=A0AAV5IV39_9ROSI|nr:hypothetical protein SLEP1_g17697 [Rubroshorea leprosula]
MCAGIECCPPKTMHKLVHVKSTHLPYRKHTYKHIEEEKGW